MSPCGTTRLALPCGTRVRSTWAATVLPPSSLVTAELIAKPASTPTTSSTAALTQANSGRMPSESRPSQPRSRVPAGRFALAAGAPAASSRTVRMSDRFSDAGGSTCSTERGSASVATRSRSTSTRQVEQLSM